MWWQRRDERKTTPTGDGSVLVQEAGAFLTGQLVQQWHDTWVTVPPWGWLTVLAHGGIGEIAKLTDSGAYRLPAERAWQAASSFLAGEVLSCAGNADTLQELQRTTLIPLELELLRGGGGATLRPSQLVRSVLDAVADFHSSTHQ